MNSSSKLRTPMVGRFIHLAIVMVFFVCSAQGQTRGYLGHRFNVEMKWSGASAWYALISDQHTVVKFVSQHQASVHFTVGKKYSIGVYRGGNTDLKKVPRAQGLTTSTGTRINTTQIGIEVRKYLGDYIAPLGTYLLLGVGKMTYEPWEEREGNWGNVTLVPSQYASQRNHVTIGLNRSAILHGPTYITYGVKSTLVKPLDTPNRLWYSISRQLFLDNLFQANLGIGVIF
jgi:hypothetical protein